jgi:hypothetical protein
LSCERLVHEHYGGSWRELHRLGRAERVIARHAERAEHGQTVIIHIG